MYKSYTDVIFKLLIDPGGVQGGSLARVSSQELGSIVCGSSRGLVSIG